MLDTQTILVVDDDDQVRGVAARILRRRGYTVLEARNGEAGLRAMHSDSIALVLSDVFMPGMDGPTMLTAMRALRPRLRLILMSGSFVAERLATGAPFLAKPFSEMSLGDAIEHELSRRRRFSSASDAS